MKIALLISGNILKAPYIEGYIRILKNENIEFNIISWNRLNLDEESSIQFNLNAGEGKAYFGRLYGYIRYISFVKLQLKKNNFDKVIVFTIPMGFFLISYLTKNYNDKYIFDIRDRSILGNIFKRRLSKIIYNSFFTVISSRGFLSWLPKKTNYIISHNCPLPIQYMNSFHSFSKEGCIITTIGTIRDYETNSRIISDLSNSNFYKLKFIGSGPSLGPLQKIVNIGNIKNVEFTGLYKKEEELNLIAGSHFINLLINLTENSKTCMGNRMYLSALTGIPLLVNAKTYQATIVEAYDLGCIINFDNNWINQVELYIQSFDLVKFNKGRQKFLSSVVVDNNEFVLKLKSFLSK
jgi:hypothetical protein